ncbi:MAG: AIR synthase-related protein, partial [Candidatus Diapherotrites archaeon]|nr:AIR synthase-related protein [Candidatus Diapherotrites archaeon]
AVSMDAKIAGDLVYVLGETRNELGASEYFASKQGIGNSVPKVDAGRAIKLYNALEKAIEAELVASVQPVGLGGFGIAIAKKCIAGALGAKIDLRKAPKSGDVQRNDFLLFSETQSRLVVTIAKEDKGEFEQILQGNAFACIGEIAAGNLEMVGLDGKKIIDSAIADLDEAYKKPLRGY